MAFLESKFKEGEHVRLKSGGPEMVVQSTNGDIITCRWVSKRDNISKIFSHLLEKVKSNDLKM